MSSRNNRDTRVRIQAKPRTSFLSELKSTYFITGFYDCEFYTVTADKQLEEWYGDIGTFPQNISEFYWCSCKINSDKYYGLCRLQNGLYVYFRLYKDYISLLDTPRESYMVISESREDLVKYAMSKHAYSLYVKRTRIMS